MKIYKTKILEEYPNPIGMEFYTFYLESSRNDTRINKDTGILIVRVVKERIYKKYDWCYGNPFEYEVVKTFKTPKTGNSTIERIVNENNAVSADVLYTSYEEAVNDYDLYIMKIFNNKRCTATELRMLEKKFINKPTKEQLAVIWYNSLDQMQKEYLKILGFNYE